MSTTRIEHTTSRGRKIVANLAWELQTLQDPETGSTEDRWVLCWDVTVDGTYANVWGPETHEGAEYVAVRTLWSRELFCVPKALWVQPPCPDPSRVRPAPPPFSDLAGTYLYKQEMARRAEFPRHV